MTREFPTYILLAEKDYLIEFIFYLLSIRSKQTLTFFNIPNQSFPCWVKIIYIQTISFACHFFKPFSWAQSPVWDWFHRESKFTKKKFQLIVKTVVLVSELLRSKPITECLSWFYYCQDNNLCSKSAEKVIRALFVLLIMILHITCNEQ